MEQKTLDPVDLLKMCILYKAIQNGWVVKKIENRLEFKIKREQEVSNILKGKRNNNWDGHASVSEYFLNHFISAVFN